MNSAPATPEFFLHVSSQSTGEVWPISSRDDPKMDARIQEHYYADEDDCSASFEIASMEDLAAVLAFYAGRKVRMEFSATVTTPEFKTTASLAGEWPRAKSASFKAIEGAELTLETASSKLIAIAHGLQRIGKKKS